MEIGYLPKAVAEHLNCPLGIAYLSAASLRHILDRHQGTRTLEDALLEMLCLPAMVKNALWIADRRGEACMSYFDPASQHRFKGAAKAVAPGYEVYVTSFHVANPKQIKSLLRRGPVLQHQR
ncbi:MAG: hypothetical protein KGL39_51565 [Patescibacteria group bacterium]|nr:hypothetical protein [Patescibacteria group bacterium]